MIRLEKARDPVDRDQLHQILDRLLDLRELTNPTAGWDSAASTFLDFQGKNQAADAAVNLANQILLATAGWAVNHRIGIAVTEATTGSLLPDEHENEIIGEKFAQHWGLQYTEDPKSDFQRLTVVRAVICALLNWDCSQQFPETLAQALAQGLRALEIGEVQPLLARKITGRHFDSAFTLAYTKLLAIEYAHYLVGRGSNRTRARDIVGGAFGVSGKTLKSWEERDLPPILGNKEIGRRRDLARRAGELTSTLERDKDFGNSQKGRTENIDPVEWLLAGCLAGTDLVKLGAEYQAELREAQTASAARS